MSIISVASDTHLTVPFCAFDVPLRQKGHKKVCPHHARVLGNGRSFYSRNNGNFYYLLRRSSPTRLVAVRGRIAQADASTAITRTYYTHAYTHAYATTSPEDVE